MTSPRELRKTRNAGPSESEISVRAPELRVGEAALGRVVDADPLGVVLGDGALCQEVHEQQFEAEVVACEQVVAST